MDNPVDYLAGATMQMLRKEEAGRAMNNAHEYSRLSSWHKKLSQSDFEYEIYDGKPRYVLRYHGHRKESQQCMFCGKTHLHNAEEGHRQPHCGAGELHLPFIEHKDGTKLYQKDGYIVRKYENI